jgi:hypothetical protein
MSPRPRPGSGAPRTRRLAAFVAVLLAAATLLAACSSDFDPSAPCTSDGRKPGAYPELESRIPTAFRGGPPTNLDSGRICSNDGLATLKGHGVDELHYAGGVWNTGSQSGVSLATFANAGDAPLQPDWVAEYYQSTANVGKNVDSVEVGDYPVAPGIVGHKVDVLNNESYQSIVVWDREGRIEIALIADFIRDIQTKAAHEAVVREAVNAWLTADGLPPVAPDPTPPAADSPGPT